MDTICDEADRVNRMIDRFDIVKLHRFVRKALREVKVTGGVKARPQPPSDSSPF